MLIECKIRRAGGTPVQMGVTLYEFKPASAAPDAPHVCEVEDDEHIARFLGIAEAYKLASGKPKKEAAPAASGPAASVAADSAATASAAGAGAASTASDSTANADAQGGEAAEPSMVIKNGRKKIDLAKMNKKALLAFAKEEGFEVDKKADEATLRTAIHTQATAG